MCRIQSRILGQYSPRTPDTKSSRQGIQWARFSGRARGGIPLRSSHLSRIGGWRRPTKEFGVVVQCWDPEGSPHRAGVSIGGSENPQIRSQATKEVDAVVRGLGFEPRKALSHRILSPAPLAARAPPQTCAKAGPRGFEPRTCGLEGRRHIQTRLRALERKGGGVLKTVTQKSG